MEKMKKIFASHLGKIVYDLCIDINLNLRTDILELLRYYSDKVEDTAKFFLDILIENASIAKKQRLPLCQDTGMVVVFIELAKDVAIVGDLYKEITFSVKRAYKDGGFRPSIVRDPVRRGKSGYIPPIIHVEYANRKSTYITVLAKGFGSENKSRLKMFLPTVGEDEIVSFIVDVVKSAGAAACPPFIVGVGIGGTSDKAMFLAKKAITLPVGKKYKGCYDGLAGKILEVINREVNLGILGVGCGPTALGVNILSYPTHIAGLPVAVNIGCHSTRSKRVRV